MTALRLHLLLGTALLAAAGCAQQPQRADHEARAAVALASAPGPATAAISAQALTKAFPPRLLVFAYDQGWRQVVAIGDKHYFCRTDAPPGSLIDTPQCVAQWQMETEQLLVQQEQDTLRQPIPYLPMVR